MVKQEQLIFIDDSGDPGFKTNNGASRMFVIACVIFDDDVDAEFASASIRLLKKQLGWKQEREFKFHRASEEHKKLFFKNAKKYSFRIRATVVDKTRVAEPRLKKSDSFYDFVILSTLQRCSLMKNASIKLDGSGSKDFRRRSTSNLRKSLNNGELHRVASFIFADSRNDNLIQLADMVAGAIRVKFDPDKKAKVDYFSKFKDKVDDIWHYE